MTTLRAAVNLANLRDQGGVTSYLEVLDVESRLFTAELDLVLASLNERTAVIQLYRGLGGGWKDTVPAAGATRIIEGAAGHSPPKDRS